MNRGIIFSLGSLFYNYTNGKNEMRLCYAANPPEKNKEGVKILGEIISGTLGKKKYFLVWIFFKIVPL